MRGHTQAIFGRSEFEPGGSFSRWPPRLRLGTCLRESSRSLVVSKLPLVPASLWHSRGKQSGSYINGYNVDFSELYGGFGLIVEITDKKQALSL